MAAWLFKTEPHVYSTDDLFAAKNHTGVWDGIRNYQARNHLRDEAQIDDLVFLYHCQCSKPGIYGLARMLTNGYADPVQFDEMSPYFDPKASKALPRWYCVDIQLKERLRTPILLPQIKNHVALQDLGIFRQPRLSVIPVSQEQASLLVALTCAQD